MRWLLVETLSRFYRWLVSPAMHVLAGPGYGCRFQPTCGVYAEEAVRRHGIVRGVFLGMKRVLQCHPWSRGGWDPVPASGAESLNIGR